jgi:hypothetical protein
MRTIVRELLMPDRTQAVRHLLEKSGIPALTLMGAKLVRVSSPSGRLPPSQRALSST